MPVHTPGAPAVTHTQPLPNNKSIPALATGSVQPSLAAVCTVGAARGIPAAPDGLPILGAGSHRDPTDGACFMEFASVLAGEPFTDHPRCTPRLVAQLARFVNDAVDDRTRQQLLPLVPAVVGLSEGPETTKAVAVAAVKAALRAEPSAGWLHRAGIRLDRRDQQRQQFPARLCRDSSIGRLLFNCANTIRPKGSAALRDLLTECVAAARSATGYSNTATTSTGDAQHPQAREGQIERVDRELRRPYRPAR